MAGRTRVLAEFDPGVLVDDRPARIQPLRERECVSVSVRMRVCVCVCAFVCTLATSAEANIEFAAA